MARFLACEVVEAPILATQITAILGLLQSFTAVAVISRQSAISCLFHLSTSKETRDEIILIVIRPAATRPQTFPQPQLSF